MDFILRRFTISKKTNAFSTDSITTVQRIYVLNLDRKPKRWNQVRNELKRIQCNSGVSLLALSRRFSAIDARYLNMDVDAEILHPYYTLADQLKVEPNPLIPLDLETQACIIRMTPPEIAIAISHIKLWREIACGDAEYTLVLEDDIYFRHQFVKTFDAAWLELSDENGGKPDFDIFFLSFQEVGVTVQIGKDDRQSYTHKPDCGIWQASGYVLSKNGAQKLVNLLPAYGPIDLWMNLQFKKLNVLLTNAPIIDQRVDVPSTNAYSIMPILSQIGVYNHDTPLITHKKKLIGPIFVLGELDTGLTSLAKALSILGYTCCSDLLQIPASEIAALYRKKRCLFNAYVNIGQFTKFEVIAFLKSYPNAGVIVTTKEYLVDLNDALYLPKDYYDKWELLCRFLKCEYPTVEYPTCEDFGQLQIRPDKDRTSYYETSIKYLQFDKLPWIISDKEWNGIEIKEETETINFERTSLPWNISKKDIGDEWRLRNDTFPDNLSIFKPQNAKITNLNITTLMFKEEKTFVRNYTSAAIATTQQYLYGRFIAEIRPVNIPGLITGMFLHRNSPHQEIDFEFLGKDTSRVLINVFYNPGNAGAKLEYGYRGTPVLINLGFDASKEFHLYEIEWSTHRIRWIVDGHLKYERVLWNPTPIPDLPMEFNINLWHSRSEELAGKLDSSQLPAISEIKSVIIM